MTVADVDGIAVLGIPRTTHRNAVDDDIARVERMDMETGRVLERYSLEEDVLAVGEAHKVVAPLLLCLGSVANIRRTVLQIPGIPQLSIVALYATHLLESLPFHIAHLGALHRSPLSTITIDDSLTGDGNVATLGCLDTRLKAR